MKIIEMGKVEKLKNGYHVTKAVVDGGGKPIHINDFLRAHGIPPNSNVDIDGIDGTDPEFYCGRIQLTAK